MKLDEIINKIDFIIPISLDNISDHYTLCDDAADALKKMKAALEEIVDPLYYMAIRAKQDGYILSNQAYDIANSVNHIQNIAKDALKELS